MFIEHDAESGGYLAMVPIPFIDMMIQNRSSLNVNWMVCIGKREKRYELNKLWVMRWYNDDDDNICENRDLGLLS